MKKINELERGQKITIAQWSGGNFTPTSGDGTLSRIVEAPLPDAFGMSVGSSFSDPFNQNVLDGPRVGGIANLASTFSGFSRKLGARTRLFYSGPEPTEISFDLNFDSYYSARDEVLLPVVKLMCMSVGRNFTLNDASEKFLDDEIDGVIEEVGAGFMSDFLSDNGSVRSTIRDMANRYGLIRSPALCWVRFGNVMKIKKAFISSTGVRFSNVLDNEFLPQSATVSVTVRMEENPTLTDVVEVFASGTRITSGQVGA